MANGIYASDGSIRVTFVPGTSWTGLYAPDGSINAVVDDNGNGLYHKCGAWRVNSTVVKGKTYDPSGAYYLSTLLGGPPVTPPVTFTPLAGSAVDLGIIGNVGAFGGTVANCFNGGQTAAAGALLALMVAAQGSMVLELAANPSSTNYFLNDAGASYFAKVGTNQFRAATEASTILIATFGSGDYTAISKLGVSWSPSGTVVVANNGTIVTNVDPLFVSGDATTVTVSAFASFRRVTGWTTQLANATLKGFTV